MQDLYKEVRNDREASENKRNCSGESTRHEYPGEKWCPPKGVEQQDGTGAILQRDTDFTTENERSACSCMNGVYRNITANENAW